MACASFLFSASRQLLNAPQTAKSRVVCARGAARSGTVAMVSRTSEPHLQLATAKLPGAVNKEDFVSNMYQWAATLTTSGQNMPFVLPLKTDRVDAGFQISMCAMKDQALASVGDLVGTVEEVQDVGNVYFVRFYMGVAAAEDPSILSISDDQKRLESTLERLIDANTIMQTMPNAIKNCAKMAME
eukprot:CAMPEP_0117668586 /NCGR_PEP_ID=MMETSP0804-20121206/11636_1 /TAXON_ID=1074897 /ORGANISM="Tetraselmis astigmatica, Strain CCMP880" /LENGTH=185 /DNA_ID=CAMNT_0005476503 /DNA_START=84 /DNA_END=641 /DNA_ORIENTATION=+